MARKKALEVGLSPCPNDTYIFGALIKGLVKPHFSYEFRLEDVETLNLLALKAELPVTKLSFGILPRIGKTYELLPVGAALGRGCGPLLVATRPALDLSKARVAVPGFHTTACLLLRLYAPYLKDLVALRYDEIIPALQARKIDAGVLIHEGRFIYRAYGLFLIADLGSWWEEKTGLPLPLGGIFIKKALPFEVKKAFLEDLKQSLSFARENLSLIWDFIRKNARELEPSVIKRHIETFVNRFTYQLGEEGKKAVLTFAGLLKEKGILQEDARDIFFAGGRL